MEKINEKFDIEEYCNMCGLDAEVFISGSGIIFLIVHDGYYDCEYEIGNTGTNAYCVKVGYRKPSSIISIKREIKMLKEDYDYE